MIVRFHADFLVRMAGFTFAWTSDNGHDLPASSPLCALDCNKRTDLHNGVCDKACFNEQCNWDGDDCLGMCNATAACRADQLGDGTCDPQCLVPGCGFDDSDCECRNVTHAPYGKGSNVPCRAQCSLARRAAACARRRGGATRAARSQATRTMARHRLPTTATCCTDAGRLRCRAPTVRAYPCHTHRARHALHRTAHEHLCTVCGRRADAAPIRAAANRRIALSFARFDVEKHFDLVTVFDGATVAAPSLYTGRGFSGLASKPEQLA
eukprot:7071994-Prymnesium_polylepis.1